MTPNFLVLTLGSICFGAFSWALRWHFRTPGATPLGVWLICGLSLAAYIWFAWDAYNQPIGAAWPFAVFLLLVAFALFFATVRVSRAAQLTVAFANDQPQILLKRGPYRFLRHPFYSTYLIFWTATAIARSDWAPWTVVVTFAAIYWVAGCREEAKFEGSRLAASYAAYRHDTGMFLPRISSLIPLTRP